MLISKLVDGQDELLTASELALLLKKDQRWIWDAARRQAIPCFRVGNHLRFSRREVEAWLLEAYRPANEV